MNQQAGKSAFDGANESENQTGIPFPKTWFGAYLFVAATFVVWLGLLMALTEFSA